MAGFNATKIQVKSSGPSQTPLEAGNYPGRLVWLILAGVQEQRPYQGKEKDPMLEIILGYEFLDEFCVDEDGTLDETKPRFLSETMPFHNLKADKARSTKRYNSIDPQGHAAGDWEQLVPSLVNLTVTQKPSSKDKSKIYNNIAEVSKMRSKDAARYDGEGVLDTRIFNLYEPDIEVFRLLPEWVQTKIKGAVDYSDSPLKGILESLGSKEEAKLPEAGKSSAPDTEEDEGGSDDW